MQKIYNYIDVLRWAHQAIEEKKMRPAERYLFLYLLHRANACFWQPLSLAAETVAKETGIRRASLFTYKKNLIEHGFLLAEENFKLNLKKFPQTEDNTKKKHDRQGVPARDVSDEARITQSLKYFGKV